MARLFRVRVLVAFLATVALLMSTSPGLVAPAGKPNQERVIVVLHNHVTDPAAVATELSRRHGGRHGFVYEAALKGFSLELPAPAVAGLARDPQVAYVDRASSTLRPTSTRSPGLMARMSGWMSPWLSSTPASVPMLT